jgi:hypothetical protein
MVNLERFDDKWVHFGFSLGVNSADFRVDADRSANDSLKILESDPQLGFNLGIVADLHLGTFFNLRFIPTLSFCQRNLNYTYSTPGNERPTVYAKPVESTYLDFPLNLKFRSARAGNFAAYVVGGFMYSYDLTSQEDVRNVSSNLDDLVVAVNRHTYSYQVGVGLDFFLQYFKFSPEFKLSMGINNNHIQDGSHFSAPINYLKSRIFLVSLTFEG